LSNSYLSMVSHTEYRYGEDGQIVARLVDFQGAPVTVDNCTASIIYPDKTGFINNSLMADSSIDGDHYLNFTTPNGPEGIYEYQATCFYTVGVNVRNQSVTNSFHLSNAFGTVEEQLDNLSTGMAANFTVTTSYLNDINNSVTSLLGAQNYTAILDEINATTTNTYQYLTGTLATNVNTILTDLGVINATVNDINATVNTILENQNNTVQMSVFSG
jgi:hypothetical protein